MSAASRSADPHPSAAVPSAAAGTGHLCARLLPPSRHALPSCSFQYPLKLISSSLPTSKCLTVFMLSYGGGLVSNDKINLTATVEDSAKLCLLTQGSTKIFKRKAAEHLTEQRLTCTLHPRAALLLLPDPVQPFADSAFTQHQVFNLPGDDSASLVVLDWVSEGRSARGEHWDLQRFASRNEFFSAPAPAPSTGDLPLPSPPRRLMLRDALVLEKDTDGLRQRMDGFTVFATMMIRGPKFRRLAQCVLARFADEPRIGGRNFDNRRDFKRDMARAGGVVWTAADVRGFVLVKVSGKELEHVRALLRDLLLGGGGGGGGDGESEVLAEFGEGALLCLQ